MRKLTAFPFQRPLQGLKNTAMYHHIRNESNNCVADSGLPTPGKTQKCPNVQKAETQDS
jgi:hypothetical protein